MTIISNHDHGKITFFLLELVFTKFMIATVRSADSKTCIRKSLEFFVSSWTDITQSIAIIDNHWQSLKSENQLFPPWLLMKFDRCGQSSVDRSEIEKATECKVVDWWKLMVESSMSAQSQRWRRERCHPSRVTGNAR